MSDLISRKALIDILAKYKFGAIKSESEREYTKETVLNFVKEQPSVTDTNVGDKWISCSERLPESSEPCLCWVKSKTISSGETFIIGSCERERFWFLQTYEIGHHHFPVKDYEVVAWMPLPEPYKGE